MSTTWQPTGEQSRARYPETEGYAVREDGTRDRKSTRLNSSH